MEVWLNEVNEVALALTLLALLIGAAELGYVLARRERRAGEEASTHAGAMHGAMLGLLALLLGFTFSLAMDRLEARKALLRDEANVIGTTYLRIQLLPEPMRARLPPLLRSYMDTRLELCAHGFELERLHELQARSAALHAQMWSQAVAAARVADTEMTSLFVDSLNQMIDMHGLRVASIRSLIPTPLFVLLFAVSIFALGLCGYVAGPDHRRALALNGMTAVLITLVTTLVFDLQRPSRGLVRADPVALVELRDSMR
ncbi:MAG TPA: hypothetical protein VFZ61_30380 [Polyangiales bacterium]